MQTVTQNLMTNWSQPVTQGYRQSPIPPPKQPAALQGAVAQTGSTVPTQVQVANQMKTSGTATTLASNSADDIQIPLGTMMYAVLDVGVDSDEPSLHLLLLSVVH